MFKAIAAAIALMFCGATTGTAHLHLYGEVDDEMAEGVDALLKTVPDGTPVEVDINGPGGSINAGMNIIESLREAGANHDVKCVDVGFAMSMSGLILLSDSCKVKVMSPLSVLHFHLPSTQVSGNVIEIEKEKAFLKVIRDSMYELLAKRIGVKKADVLMARVDAGENVLFTPQEALAWGLIDKVGG